MYSERIEVNYLPFDRKDDNNQVILKCIMDNLLVPLHCVAPFKADTIRNVKVLK